MYLHIGAETEVSINEVIAIFDVDSIKKSESAIYGKNVTISDEKPKSAILTDKGSSNKKFTIYLSPISTTTLQKRLKSFYSKTNFK